MPEIDENPEGLDPHEAELNRVRQNPLSFIINEKKRRAELEQRALAGDEKAALELKLRYNLFRWERNGVKII